MFEWYLARKGAPSGPYTLEQLQQFAREGHIHNDDLLWNEQLENWTQASQIETIANLLAPVDHSFHSGDVPVKKPRRKLILTLCLALPGVVLLSILVFMLFPGSGEDITEPGESPAIVTAGELSEEEAAFLSEAKLTGLSAEQKELFAMFGAPSHFTILFAVDWDSETLTRTETWVYPDLNYIYAFRNGSYIGGKRAAYISAGEGNFHYTPLHFTADLSPEDIVAFLGSEPEKVEETGPVKTYHYKTKKLALSFDRQGRLLSVVRAPEVLDY